MTKVYVQANVESIDFAAYQENKDGVLTFSVNNRLKLKKGNFYSTFKLAKIMLRDLTLAFLERKSIEAQLSLLKGKAVKPKTALSLSKPVFFKLSWKGVEIDTMKIKSQYRERIKLLGDNPIAVAMVYLTGMLNVAMKSGDIKSMKELDAFYTESGIAIDDLMKQLEGKEALGIGFNEALAALESNTVDAESVTV